MRDIGESLSHRLRDKARQWSINTEAMTTHWGMERFLRRLSLSDHGSHFILKGGLLFPIWENDFVRATGGVDLHDLDDNNAGHFASILADIVKMDIDDGPDGIIFDLSRARSTKLAGSGERLSFSARLGSGLVRLHVDVSYGHAITPGPERRNFPAIFGEFRDSSVLCYPQATAIAEKLGYAVEFGNDNTRVGDYYDLWFLSHRYSHDGRRLVEAINQTFSRRDAGRFLQRNDSYWEAAFHPSYVTSAREKTWTNWNRIRAPRVAPPDIRHMVAKVAEFAVPLLCAVRDGKRDPGRWLPEQGWSSPRRSVSQAYRSAGALRIA